ncbi:MAG: alanine racemase [Myxococcota bacterium]
MIRPTVATVDLAALRGNLGAVRALVTDEAARRRRPAPRLLAAVKGDAYGHGAVACARALDEAGCDAFGVALVEEGAQLRDAGIARPILCLGGTGRYGAEEAVARSLVPVLYDEGDAERIDAAARAAGSPHPVHLKVDTGMGRLGVPLPHWEHFLDRIARFRWLDVQGLMTHFAESESEDPTFTLEQARRFKEAVAMARARGFRPATLHCCNSGGVLFHPATHMDLVRPGIVLYGVRPRAHPVDVRPVMRVATQVLFVRDLPTGASVSYGRSFVTKRPSRVATLPVGYADGYPRALGGKADVLIGGRRCPVVGVVCMDLCMADVTDLPSPVESGDEVVLLGRQGHENVTAEELAGNAGTIPYEILCGFSERVPRRAA